MNSTRWIALSAAGLAFSLLLGTGAAKAWGGTDRAGTVSQTSQIAKSETDDHRKEHRYKTLPIFEESAKIIGIKTEELQKEVAQGKSIVDVAKSKGVNEKTLTEKLLELRQSGLDEAVKSGKLSKEQAAQLKKRLNDHIVFLLNKKGLSGYHGRHHHHIPLFTGQLAEILGMPKEEIMKQWKSGKSLAEIAQSKGLSREQLIVKIKEKLTPLIERSIDLKYKKEE